MFGRARTSLTQSFFRPQPKMGVRPAASSGSGIKKDTQYAVTVEGERLTFMAGANLYGYHLVKLNGRWEIWAPAYSPEEQAVFRARLWRRFWDREADLEVIVRPFQKPIKTEEE